MKIAVISDLHYFSPRLSDNGYAYRLRSTADQKCLSESGGIIREALAEIKRNHAQALLIAGDITDNGETVCHREILAILQEFDREIPVYPITSTHDWCSNGHAARYEGENVYTDVPVYTKEQLKSAYEGFGKARKIACFETGKGFVSSVFQIGENLRVIAVNDDADGENGASGYSPSHLKWMCDEIKKAKADGCLIFAMQHHLLLPCIHPFVNRTQRIANGDEVCETLAKSGLRLMIVGHSHMQRTCVRTYEDNSSITQINMGALTGYPAPIMYLEIDENTVKAKVMPLKNFEYNGEKLDDGYIKAHTTGVLLNVLHLAQTDKKMFYDFLSANGIHIKALEKCYPLIKKACIKAEKMTVGDAVKLINVLTCARNFDKTAVKSLKNEKLLPYLVMCFLFVFDGSKDADKLSTAQKRMMRDVAVLPQKLIRRLPLPQKKKLSLYRTAKSLEETLTELIFPAYPDNYECEILL